MMYPWGLISWSARGVADGHSLRNLTPHQRGLMHHDPAVAGTPILLVHGIVDNHSIFTVLQRALRRRGFSNLASFDYGLLTSDVPGTAQRLGATIAQLAADSGYEKIHVIGHSLGGLMARYFAQKMGGDDLVHTLVTLGTPHQGTALARAGQFLPLVGQLTPQSELMRTLAAPAPGCTTRFVAFASDLDQLIVPSTNAEIHHRDLDTTNIAVQGVGHMSMPHNRTVAFRIAAVLSELDPNRSAARRGGHLAASG